MRGLEAVARDPGLSPQQKAGSFVAAALAANHAPTTQIVVDIFGAGETLPLDAATGVR